METCACHEIPKLSCDELVLAVEKKLTKIKDFSDSWKVLYQCSSCKQFWELSYPAAGEVCCVEPELSKSNGVVE